MAVRVVACYSAVPQDPGTGTASGARAGHLVRHRYSGDGRLDVTVPPGHAIGRPRSLRLVAEARDGAI